eukprot:TRINITY_DN11711_c0_g1_i1.p1 TRINITY_DN11711_c0_g1~~TRINITY_DN11711_c0_g1_i1.p1  ORF type:complete len:111 (+),score=19.97 TRINITY_DN11711_c0_g1_i1:67-399(+)
MIVLAIRACIPNQWSDLAEQYLSESSKETVDSVALVSAMQACVHDLEVASRIFVKFNGRSSPHATTLMIQALGSAGKDAEADAMVTSLPENDRGVAVTCLMQICRERNQP